MAAFELALLLILLLAALSVAGRRLPWPQPITFALGGAGAALLPGFPRVELDPGFFFLCFVPPLLFSDGWLMPLRDFLAAKRPILMLATGLVVLTTLVVGFVAWWLIPGLPLAMGFALGAVVSPTDAVAVSAITHRLKVPPRFTTVLNGESLMNDATGLVAFKFALAAVFAGTFSLRAAALDFLWVALAGLAVGLVLAWAVGRGRDLLARLDRSDEFIEITLSLLTPYAAYLAAEHLHVSGILAVVAAGLYSGWRDPLRMSVRARQTTWTVWAVVLFWLNGLAFILLGLQFPALLAAVAHSYSVAQLALFTGAVAAAAILARLAWIFPGAYLPFVFSSHVRRTEPPPSWQTVLAAGWAGMRGSVTLAAALSIPLVQANGTPFPGRDIVIFLSLGVIFTTLLVQGTTLEYLICKLRLPADDTRVKEDRIARIRAVEHGLASLRELEKSVESPEETAALGVVVAEYEHRLAELTAQGETQAAAQARRQSGRKHRLHALRAERHALAELLRENIITADTHRPLQQLLDHEEAMLAGMPAHVED
jgi:CPA1 family monovalent cation:H+ antiporter